MYVYICNKLDKLANAPLAIFIYCNPTMATINRTKTSKVPVFRVTSNHVQDLNVFSITDTIL